MEKYGGEAKEKGIKTEEMIMGKYGKKSWKPFYEKMHGLGRDTVKAIEESTYSNALLFFRAFNAQGSAARVRAAMK
jgi:hypothetical protein